MSRVTAKNAPRQSVVGQHNSRSIAKQRNAGFMHFLRNPLGSGLVWRIAALLQLDIASYAVVGKSTALHQTRLTRGHVRLNQSFPKP